ncbi:MAG: MarR family transcriptional regulator [Nevskia sp.]|nr:MarR family transcriptional regulator [Nevskia sp.]
MARREGAQAARSGREAAEGAAEPAEAFAIGDADDVSRQGIRLGFLIHDVSRMRRNAYDQVMKPLGVTRAQWWVLAHLSRHDGMMQTELADVLDVGKASLGTLIERLEAGGWVERRADPSDKRAKRVFLARSGQQLVRKMTLEENRFNDRILNELNGADREQLIRLLSKIKHALIQYGVPEAGDVEA